MQQLDKILEYKNEDVICRFTDLLNVTDDEAEDIFLETKKFLFLSQYEGIFIPDELLILDEMWHNFILFTREYAAFCQANFGRFVHHQPATRAEKLNRKAAIEANPEANRAEFNKKLEVLISAVFDHLGQETVLKWFSTYPQIYSPQNIKDLRKA
ncbi:glycine-rich domain-containing protein [Desertivirga brevis]|uniref:glycine-rich domain-containing protein n=1 Tax=Desertivirga brevis TaxID=2810310 RepID=UPI001A963986|nr:hypothetical protein [Pedobacter sp. SYSU D00873]